DWTRALLDAVEKKQVQPFEVDAARRQQLVLHKNGFIRGRAVKLFAESVNPDRQKVIDSYQSVLTLKGDATRGAQLFATNCAARHRFGGVGNAVGSDLASVGDKSPEGLLIAILDPNRNVEARYVSYTAQTKNGLTYTGVLASETATSITLISQEGKEQVILRTNLYELTSSGKSAMPEGLEKDLRPQDVPGMISHVRGSERPPQGKTFEGNKPEVVRPAADGVLLLTPAACEIYGPTLVLEKKYGNLGYWASEGDHAIWQAEVAKAGR